jgi:hypothetical protein
MQVEKSKGKAKSDERGRWAVSELIKLDPMNV